MWKAEVITTHVHTYRENDKPKIWTKMKGNIITSVASNHTSGFLASV